MNRYLIVLAMMLLQPVLQAQDPEGSYNPYVNAGTISPAPLHPLQADGTGIISFNFGNSGGDPLGIYTDQFITLTVSLSYGEPDSTDPLVSVGGSAAGLFTWTYSGGTYTAIQNATIPASYSGTITIDYKVTQNSGSPGSNGFNVNISPAPYQTNSNSTDDDAVSSYTYTEIRDYGDAPESYGAAYHIIDFTRYLGELIDGEDENQPSANADADDLNGLADEDGVVFPAEMHRGEIVDIAVTVAGMGYLNVWIDWNGDGDFNDAGEYVVNNAQRMSGTANISVTVPFDAIITQPTFARFRFSAETLTLPTGGAIGGEVEDYQITLLCAIPDPPEVSDNAPENLCPDITVDLTALVTSSIPEGGALLFKTENNPSGADLADPSQAVAGQYYLFHMNSDGCYSVATEVVVTINACPPDVTPTLIVRPNIMNGPTTFELIVRVTELNDIETVGQITVNIPKDQRWLMTDGFVQSLTSLGGTVLNNSDWSYSDDAVNHIFTMTSPVTASGSSTFGFRVTFDPGSARGFYTITAQIVSGSGGEVRVSNNADSEKIDYFQQ
jgi:hypothetical protein